MNDDRTRVSLKRKEYVLRAFVQNISTDFVYANMCGSSAWRCSSVNIPCFVTRSRYATHHSIGECGLHIFKMKKEVVAQWYFILKSNKLHIITHFFPQIWIIDAWGNLYAAFRRGFYAQQWEMDNIKCIIFQVRRIFLWVSSCLCNCESICFMDYKSQAVSTPVLLILNKFRIVHELFGQYICLFGVNKMFAKIITSILQGHIKVWCDLPVLLAWNIIGYGVRIKRIYEMGSTNWNYTIYIYSRFKHLLRDARGLMDEGLFWGSLRIFICGLADHVKSGDSNIGLDF